MARAHLERVDDVTCRLTGSDLDVRVVANSDVRVDAAAVDELAELAELGEVCDRLSTTDPERWSGARVERIVCTPDFHKGAGIPIGSVIPATGVVIPAAIGNDVGCGMRLVATDLDAGTFDRDQFRARFGASARHLFFEGGRNTPLDGSGRVAVLEAGAAGLRPDGGLWERWNDDLAGGDRTHRRSIRHDADIDPFASWARPEDRRVGHDAVLGSIGGSNHFVEIQQVRRVVDPAAAWTLGLSVGQIVVMAHTGSVSIGHTVGSIGDRAAAAAWPTGVVRPRTVAHPCPDSDPGAARWLAAVAGAANFAEANRATLTVMALAALDDALGRPVDGTCVWDAPHNLIWDDGDRWTHRKGATPAGGHAAVDGGPYVTLGGEPVLVPGSMGASSWVLVGAGAELTCSSACHGAGRAVARGKARSSDRDLDAFLEQFQIVTPLDPDAPHVAGRRDLLSRWRAALAEEAPWAYKDVGPVVDTLEAAGVARRVVELEPIATIKA